jgi:multiple sugar transport system substrate-binding protein
MHRQRWQRTITFAAFLLLTVMLGIWSTATAADFNWKRYSGTTIRVLMDQIEWINFMKPLTAEFEELSGIKVVYDIYPEDQRRQKLAMEFAGRMSTADVFYMQPINEGPYFEKAGYIVHLESFLKDPSLTQPEYDWQDFSKLSIENATVNGHIIAVPIMQEVSFLGYRKDLFEKHGVKVPTTFDEFKAAAAKLTLDGGPGGKIFGITMRGKKAAATSQWVVFLYGMGGRWLTEDRKPAINSPEAVEAFKTYGELLRNWGPPGAVNDTLYEVTSLFQQGRAAMMIDTSSRMQGIEDPAKSSVAGKVGYAVVPGGKAGQRPGAFANCLAISSFSKKQEAAWLFVQWASNKQNSLRNLLAGQSVPRESSWQAEAFRKIDKHPDMTQTILKSGEIGNKVVNPPVVAVAQAREIVGQVIVDSILGKTDVKDSADKAASDLAKLMKETE